MTGSNEQMDRLEKRYGAVTIAEAVTRLCAGGVVAVPTETVYGLAADSSNAAAVAEIYRTKGRPDFNPLIVHVPDLDAAQLLGKFDSLALMLVEHFWPGPLTLVLHKTADCPVAEAVTAGLDTIAVRCPDHPVMQNLLEASGLYLAAPSANKSGGLSPTKADHVQQSLGFDAPLILDGGPSDQGLESTIVAVRGDGYQILRPGPVSKEELIAVTGLEPLAVTNQKIEAPGQLANHYAPSKPVRLNILNPKSDEYHIGFGNISGAVNLSNNSDLAEAAANLFAFLHQADDSDLTKIAIAPIPDDGIGSAINDRLRRASAPT